MKLKVKYLIAITFITFIFTSRVFATDFKTIESDEEINIKRYAMPSSLILESNREKEKELYEKTGVKLQTKHGYLRLPWEISEEEQKKIDEKENFKRYKMTSEEIEKNNKEKSDIIFKRTGYRITTTNGVLMLPEEMKNNVELRAVNIPTSYCPYYPYQSNWSGTRNFTYSKYIFKSGSCYANADNYFQISIMSPSGRQLGWESSTRYNGRESVWWGVDQDYYLKLTNLTNSPMSRAYYGASR